MTQEYKKRVVQGRSLHHARIYEALLTRVYHQRVIGSWVKWFLGVSSGASSQ